MKLDHRIQALIAVGASVSANCQPCLERAVCMARECGADSQEIAEAIEVGKRVRHGAAAKMDRFALGLNSAAPSVAGGTEAGCECVEQIAGAGGSHG